MNAAAALYAADAVKSLEEGLAAASESIDSGAALDKVRELAALTARMGMTQEVGVS